MGENSEENSQAQNLNKGYETHCGCLECYSVAPEYLEYNYTYDDDNPNKTQKQQPYPRIRERGEHYVDSYNDQAWSWTFGTYETVR